MTKKLLMESGKPLVISELIAGIKSRFGVNKTKQHIRNALNAYDTRDIVRIDDGIYDLLSRVVNGIYFRFTPTDAEIERGILNCNVWHRTSDGNCVRHVRGTCPTAIMALSIPTIRLAENRSTDSITRLTGTAHQKSRFW